MDNEYLVWDPMLCRWDGKWWLYALADKRTGYSGNADFWMRKHSIYGWVSDDFVTWESLGRCVTATGTDRLCAGCVVPNGAKMLLFVGHNVRANDQYTLDQRPALYESRDGANWDRLDDPFSIDSNWQTGLIVDGEPWYACRDMYHVLEGKQHCLFVPTGGARWNTETRVMVLSSDNAEGPYRTLGAAAKDIRWNNCEPLDELERVSVLQVGDKWYMTGHCWSSNVCREHQQGCGEKGEHVTFSTMHLLESNDLIGPYRMVRGFPYIKHSSKTGQFGALLHQHKGQVFGLGWHRDGWCVSPNTAFVVDTERMAISGEYKP
jgi:hypothetical protein